MQTLIPANLTGFTVFCISTQVYLLWDYSTIDERILSWETSDLAFCDFIPLLPRAVRVVRPVSDQAELHLTLTRSPRLWDGRDSVKQCKPSALVPSFRWPPCRKLHQEASLGKVKYRAPCMLKPPVQMRSYPEDHLLSQKNVVLHWRWP